MIRSSADEIHLSREDRAFVLRLGQETQPPRPGAGRREAFRTRLRERRERGWWRAVGAASLSAATGAALLGLWLAPPGAERPPAPVPGEELLGEALLALTDAPAPIDRDDSLPEEYSAISSAFLEGL